MWMLHHVRVTVDQEPRGREVGLQPLLYRTLSQSRSSIDIDIIRIHLPRASVRSITITRHSHRQYIYIDIVPIRGQEDGKDAPVWTAVDSSRIKSDGEYFIHITCNLQLG